MKLIMRDLAGGILPWPGAESQAIRTPPFAACRTLAGRPSIQSVVRHRRRSIMNSRQLVTAALFIAAIGVVAVGTGLPGAVTASAAKAKAPFPEPAVDDALAPASGRQSFVVAGGCFWGVQAVFQHVKGVVRATSGYAGGDVKNPSYEQVSSGRTGHAESVEVVYDPSQVTYGQLLRVFFSVAHNPTELNRQGPDEGTQYRSVIFFANPRQQEIAKAYVAQLDTAKVFGHPIVTQVTPFSAFYVAEAYHQDYATLHPENPYIAYNDAPKVANLHSQLPDLWVEKRAATK
jgi:peptide-methionine (S)-S-oxide reductase